MNINILHRYKPTTYVPIPTYTCGVVFAQHNDYNENITTNNSPESRSYFVRVSICYSTLKRSNITLFTYAYHIAFDATKIKITHVVYLHIIINMERLCHIENVNGKLIIEFFYFQSEFAITYLSMQSAVCIQIFTQVKSFRGIFGIHIYSYYPALYKSRSVIFYDNPVGYFYGLIAAYQSVKHSYYTYMTASRIVCSRKIL